MLLGLARRIIEALVQIQLDNEKVKESHRAYAKTSEVSKFKREGKLRGSGKTPTLS